MSKSRSLEMNAIKNSGKKFTKTFSKIVIRDKVYKSLIKGASAKQRRIPVEFSTGCTNKCSFCFEGGCDQVIFRDTKDLINEIQVLMNEGYNDFWLTGSELNSHSSKYIYNFCDEIQKLSVESRQNLNFSGYFLGKNIKKQLIALLEASRFTNIGITIGSFSSQVRTINQIPLSESDVLQTIDAISSATSQLTLSGIIGLPGETKATLNETLDFLKTNKAHLYKHTINLGAGACAYLGTPLFERNSRSMKYYFSFSNPIDGTIFSSPFNPLEIEKFFSSELNHHNLDLKVSIY